MIRGEESVLDRGVYSESLYPLLHYGWAPLRALRTDDRKLISAPRREMFDIENDPREKHDLSLEQPAAVEDLEARLAELREQIETAPPSGGGEPDLDAQTLAQLQALGYVAGQGGVDLEDEGDQPRADPKDKIGLHRTIMRAQTEMGSDQDAAEKTLVAVLRKTRGSSMPIRCWVNSLPASSDLRRPWSISDGRSSWIPATQTR